MKKTIITDLRSFFKVSCHMKFRFAEREAQCILGECGPFMRMMKLHHLVHYTIVNNLIFPRRISSELYF